MYQPVLNRFLSRDPLPPDGQPDILYDNNWYGDRMTWMRNTYGYCDNNPVNKGDPSGMQAAPPPVRPIGLWRCAPPNRIEFLRVDETYYTLFCLPCTHRCRLIIYGQRCFHDSVTVEDDSDPLKAYTVMYAEFQYTRRECAGVPLPDRKYSIGGCELYPLRLIAPDNPLDVAVQKYLEEVETCQNFDFDTMCAELQKVPPPPPAPKK